MKSNNSINDKLNDFPWKIVNKENKKDYKFCLCLSSAIREKEFLEEKGKIVKILPTQMK